MPALREYQVECLYHATPLHHLPYIARTRSLLAKTVLAERGFDDHHFRTTSKKQDVERGFGNYLHLTPENEPALLRAKLRSGFPHCTLVIEEENLAPVNYLLCRFNIARTRYFAGAKSAPVESRQNGRYSQGFKLPVASKEDQKRAMLSELAGKIGGVEVLVERELALSENTEVVCYHKKDQDIVLEILESAALPWTCTLSEHTYERSAEYGEAVQQEVRIALEDPNYIGGKIEFDRV